MKTLLLLRHAKSIGSGVGIRDFDRPLNERGRKAATLVGEQIKAQGLNCEMVLSSPALRARETTELVMQESELPAEVRYDRRIYDASASQLLEVVSELEPSCESALLVGHNPGMEEFVRLLTGRAEPMSTASLARIDIDAQDWAKLPQRACTLRWVTQTK